MTLLGQDWQTLFAAAILALGSDTGKPLRKVGQGGGVKTDRDC